MEAGFSYAIHGLFPAMPLRLQSMREIALRKIPPLLFRYNVLQPPRKKSAVDLYFFVFFLSENRPA
jgi:hypothetical protein